MSHFFKCASVHFIPCTHCVMWPICLFEVPADLYLIVVSPLLGSLIWVPVAHHHQVELV